MFNVNFRYLFLIAALFLLGCKSTVEKRRNEKAAFYNSLSPEIKTLVDQGQIRIGMPEDAVYISWGAPEQILESEDAGGHNVTWLYHGTYLQETRYWNFREVSRDGTVFLDRYLDHAYDPQDFVKAEIVFQNGKVKSWRTLPAPLAK